MTTPTPLPPDKPRKPAFPMPGLIVAPAVAALLAFLLLAPDGLLTKTALIGYAVCHRLPEHSIFIAGRQLPLCARCSGTFMGAVVGFLGQAVVLRRRRASEFPSPAIIAILVGFMLLWAGDGLNSYLDMIGGPHLYEPRNWLRLTTGALNGLTMSALVYPVFNYTLWREPAPQQAIRHLGDLGVLTLLEAGLVGLTLTRWPWLLYPLALLSALGVMTLLTSVTSILILIVVRRENVVNRWRESLIPLLAGFLVSLILIVTIDVVRYTITHTLTGIPLR